MFFVFCVVFLSVPVPSYALVHSWPEFHSTDWKIDVTPLFDFSEEHLHALEAHFPQITLLSAYRLLLSTDHLAGSSPCGFLDALVLWWNPDPGTNCKLSCVVTCQGELLLTYACSSNACYTESQCLVDRLQGMHLCGRLHHSSRKYNVGLCKQTGRCLFPRGKIDR